MAEYGQTAVTESAGEIAATLRSDSTSVRVAPSMSVMLPVSGSGLRPWPGKSNVTAT